VTARPDPRWGRDDLIPVAIEVDGGARTLAAVARCPPAPTRGVVVLHELFGPQPEIGRVIERFSQAGYAAIAPDLFSAGALRCVAQLTRAMRTGDGPAVDRIAAVRAWLCAETGLAPDHIGLIGFCFGGGFALAVGRGWGAISANYGRLPAEAALAGLGPTIACFGARDRSLTGAGPALDAALTRAGVPHEVHVVPDVGHSFLTDGHHPIAAACTATLLRIGFDPTAAEASWARIFAYFDHHLGAPRPGGPG